MESSRPIQFTVTRAGVSLELDQPGASSTVFFEVRPDSVTSIALESGEALRNLAGTVSISCGAGDEADEQVKVGSMWKFKNSAAYYVDAVLWPDEFQTLVYAVVQGRAPTQLTVKVSGLEWRDPGYVWPTDQDQPATLHLASLSVTYSQAVGEDARPAEARVPQPEWFDAVAATLARLDRQVLWIAGLLAAMFVAVVLF